MKKKSLIIVVVIIVCILGIGYYFISKPTKESKYVKDLLIGLSTSSIKDKNKEFELHFKQKYNLKSSTNDDIEINNFSIDYDAEGAVMILYNLDKESDNENFDIVEAMNKGNGYIIGSKLEKYNYHNEEIIKSEKDNESNTIEENSISSLFYELKVDDKKLYVSSKNYYIDNLNSNNNKEDEFKASIDKNLITDNISDNIINDSVLKIIYMDAFDFINEIDSNARKLLNEMNFNNSISLNIFAKDNKINIEEQEDKIKITFALDAKEWLNDMLNEEEKELPRIKGELELDKKTKKMTYIKYDLKDYLLSILNEKQEESSDFSANVDEFIVEGRMSDKSTYEATIDNATEYNSNELDKFIEKFRDYLIEYN